MDEKENMLLAFIHDRCAFLLLLLFRVEYCFFFMLLLMLLLLLCCAHLRLSKNGLLANVATQRRMKWGRKVRKKQIINIFSVRLYSFWVWEFLLFSHSTVYELCIECFPFNVLYKQCPGTVRNCRNDFDEFRRLHVAWSGVRKVSAAMWGALVHLAFWFTRGLHFRNFNCIFPVCDVDDHQIWAH